MTFLANIESLENSDWLIAVTRARDAAAGVVVRRHYGPGPHKSGTPQSVHGANFGDTVHPTTGKRPTTGYQVGQPTGSMIVPRAAYKADNGVSAGLAFIERNRAVFDANPDVYMGVWLDKAKQEIDLDVSHNIQDLDAAMDQARQWDQQAIWDNVRGRVIMVGGTGARDYAEGGRSTSAGVLGLDRGREARMGGDLDARGAWGSVRRVGRRDPEVVAALDRFYRHLAGQHDQKSHGRKGGSGGPRAALDAAEGAGQRVRKPITSAVQLDEQQRASADAAWEPWTRRRKDTGEKVVIQVDRQVLKDHIGDTIKGATPEQREAGMRWYQDAHDFSMELAREFDVEPRVAVGVVAALSPNTGWDANKTKARNALERFKSGKFDHLSDGDAAVAMNLAFKQDAIQAVRIMRDPDAAFAAGLPTGPKRGSFVNNILHPENSFDVTVDGWVTAALQRSSHGMSQADGLAWLGRSTNQAKTTGLVVEDKGYIAVADVVREIASGMGMTPAQAQAVYWVAVGGGQAGAKMWEDG